MIFVSLLPLRRQGEKNNIQTRRKQMAIVNKCLKANSGSSTIRRILKRNMKARIERLKKETKEIRKEQKDIAEGHREIAKKLHLIKTSHAQMKKDIQVLNQGSARLQCRLNIMFKILKARKLGDSIEEKKLVQLLLSITPPNKGVQDVCYSSKHVLEITCKID
ncbi:uncharacterized protein LOC120016307 isoform X2 [Tripterygium wilfordii]|uniref:uncharacterized protein LOC120016307 isoform X2 n=1 Tax=Tripterygium wilfordii TaxID=458696 RepID=UPI0018F85E55|nr:uncharacterized protein LOC120016307 isoform X2 [Tripterygium wilfordii]